MQNLPLEKTPKHVAIIMDGNGRWAQKRGHPRVYGHIRGARQIHGLVQEAGKMGIRALTLYAFSTENWTRPESEKSVLWKLFTRYLKKETRELGRENVRLNIIGEIQRLPSDVQKIAADSVQTLKSNTGLQLNLAISYGGRQEIVDAAKKIALACKKVQIDPQEITEKTFSEFLYTGFLGPLSDVDLVIRTSGEKRISNFLLFQSAYAEYIFAEECFPDFSPDKLKACVAEYSTRKRRFGGIESAT